MIRNLPSFIDQKICLSCDGCCRFKERNSPWRPKMSGEEIDAYCFDKPESAGEVFFNALDENGYIKEVARQGQVWCTFFRQEDHICRVYEGRPFECRLYPFLMIKKGDKTVIGVHLCCPYVQEKRQDADFRSYVGDLQEYFQQREILEFIRRNPSLVGDYPEDELEVEDLFTLAL